MNTENPKFNSELQTLREISENNLFFNIPIYQRLYVWQSEQVQVLLEDLIGHFEATPDEDYFLGTVVVVKNGDIYDLIDGQQRFTTLWLILKELQDVTFASSKRLQFAIRPHATAYFENPVASNDAIHVEMENITRAQETIKGFLKTKGNNDLIDKLLNKIKIIFTEVPQNVDLNKLFEAFNSGGVQLQQHELLKAKLLKYLIDDPERQVYEKMWTACSWMNTYIEEGVVLARGGKKSGLWGDLEISKAVDNNDSSLNEFVSRQLLIRDNIFSVISGNNGSVSAGNSLKDILEARQIVVEPTKASTSDDDGEADKCRNMIGFPLFLLHCLRIYQKENNGTDIKNSEHVGINDKKLLKIYDDTFFEPVDKEEKEAQKTAIKKLIKTIWKVRVLFDQWVIKWVKLEDSEHDEIHSIQSLSKSSNTSGTYLRRGKEPEEIKALSILQSMLYHTQELRTHYWLTPLLNHLLCSHNHTPQSVFEFLQNMDNRILPASRFSDYPMSKRTWDYMQQPCGFPDSKGYLECLKALNDGKEHNNYSRFELYNLNKIDFILWFNAHTLTSNEPEWKLKNKEYKSSDFLLKRRNSIEHVAPQNPDEKEDGSEISGNEQLLNGLGNLVLLSSGDNSSQSNKGFNQKISWLQDQKEWYNHPKLSHIVRVWEDEGHWNEKAYDRHLKYVCKEIEQYLSNNNQQS